jgi:hypothetical protein
MNTPLIRQSRMLECWNAGMHKSHLSPSANIHAKACMFLVKGLKLRPDRLQRQFFVDMVIERG